MLQKLKREIYPHVFVPQWVGSTYCDVMWIVFINFRYCNMFVSFSLCYPTFMSKFVRKRESPPCWTQEAYRSRPSVHLVPPGVGTPIHSRGILLTLYGGRGMGYPYPVISWSCQGDPQTGPGSDHGQDQRVPPNRTKDRTSDRTMDRTRTDKLKTLPSRRITYTGGKNSKITFKDGHEIFI